MDSGNMGIHTWFILIIFYVVSVECDLYGQAHPPSCAAAIAVQKVIAAENLLENGRQAGKYLAQLLRERLQSVGALAYPFVFDVRDRGVRPSSLTRLGPKAKG